MNDVTQLLHAMGRGDPDAVEQLIPLVYDELRRMASRKLPPGTPDTTLEPTALVHEVWLKLGGVEMNGYRNRAHFFATAATAMRSILVDRARRRSAIRHGGGLVRVDIDGDVAGVAGSNEQVLAVHDALEQFALEDAPKAELVKLRYFAGLTLEQAADVLEISVPTAKRWWAYARGWLGREIRF